jgi:hypothetical protein
VPSGSYRQIEVRCPFYQSDDGKRRIICEGIVDGSTIAVNYRRRADLQKQISIFCACHYEKCEIHRMLMNEKYKEE